LGGGATNVSVTNLSPAGLTSTVDAPNKTVTISGTPTAMEPIVFQQVKQLLVHSNKFGVIITVNPIATFSVTSERQIKPFVLGTAITSK
jgi:hypothetical protein